MPSRKKRTKKGPKRVELTPEEIKAARTQHKNATRKLKQLADRAEQKKRRAELYATLRENAISSEEMALLSSSSTWVSVYPRRNSCNDCSEWNVPA